MDLLLVVLNLQFNWWKSFGQRGEIDVRFLISRVSHLVTRRTVRSFRVKNRTPNFGDGGGVIRSRCFKYFPHTVWISKEKKSRVDRCAALESSDQ